VAESEVAVVSTRRTSGLSVEPTSMSRVGTNPPGSVPMQSLWF